MAVKQFTNNSYSGGKGPGFGWLGAFAAVAANALIFFSISWVNRAPANPPRQEQVFVELFQPQVAPRLRRPVIDSTPVIVPREFRPRPAMMRTSRMEDVSMSPRISRLVPEALDSLPGVITAPAAVDMVGQASAAVGGDVVGAGQVDKPPVKISGDLPRYPGWAKANRAEGIVTLRFLVRADGTVGDVEVYSIKGDSRFAAAAREEVRKWLFRPAINMSRPVAVWCFQTINFELEN